MSPAQKALRDLALLLLVVVAFAIPFLRQPFHMDDNFYMDMARNANVKPFFPNDTPYIFEGHLLPDMGSHSHPPLVTYFLAALQRIVGEGPGKELAYHSAALIFPILAVWSFYFIAGMYVARPLWASLGLAVCPLFLVMQHTLMTDVPTLSFWLAAVAAFVWAAETGRSGLYAASALFQFAAMFTSYHSALLAPLLALYQYRKGSRRTGWITLLFAPALMAGWFSMNYLHYHRWILGGTLGYIQTRNPDVAAAVMTKLAGLFSYQGWLIVFPFFMVCVFGRVWKGRLAALLLLLAIYIAQLMVPQYRLADKCIFVVGLTAGILLTIRMAETWKNPATGEASARFRRGIGCLPRSSNPEAFLGTWYFGVAACCFFLFTEGSARYLLPLVPPAILIFFRDLESREIPEYRLPSRPVFSSAMLASGSIVISLVWGLVLSQADLEFAGIYPRAADEIRTLSGGLPSYYGGEWGYRYYMRQAGALQLPVDESQVRGGSFISLPSLALAYNLPAGLESTTAELQTLTYELATPVRLLDRRSNAGFYSTAWGLLPFGITRSSLESIEVRQVNYFADQLPYARIQTQSDVLPWPGYATVRGKRVLSLMTKPGSRIAYPWTIKIPVSLDVQCGVLSEAVLQGDCEFEIRQLDASGKILHAATQKSTERDRWFDLSLRMEPVPGTLELELSGPYGIEWTGAFAGPVLRPARATKGLK
jgi:general stress protein CsbA